MIRSLRPASQNLTFADYQDIKEDVRQVLANQHCGPGQYTQESYCGPIFVRLSWHDAGTYSALTDDGGPHACMRHAHGESEHAANNGLDVARDHLEPLEDKWSGKISHADLWALAAVTSIEEMRGPSIPFRLGRWDGGEDCSVEEGRLPDGDESVDEMRDLFAHGRMNFTDQEIVALLGAHTLGECHLWNSGYELQWGLMPTIFNNDFFKDLVDEFSLYNWRDHVTSAGKTQKVSDRNTMMLLADFHLWEHAETKDYVQSFADDQDEFFKVFSDAFQRLQENSYVDTDLVWPDDLPMEL